MAEDDERRIAFEARLAELKRKMESGLAGRAKNLRDAAARLVAGDQTARKVLKQEGHKLRGIAGSYGHQHLTDLAADLELRASLSPPPMLETLASQLAAAAEEVSERSEKAANKGQQATLATAPAVVTGTSPEPPSRKRGGSLKPQVQSAEGGALRVLAMDDDPTTLRLLRLTLRDIGGFDALIVTSAREAIETMRIREFDAVVSDAMMPDMNGKEFCVAARALGGWAAQVPIIILSAATADELGWKGGLPESTAWLRKPFMPSTLVRDVARIVLEARART
jgi:CheY-like chemotaxis protein